jgi:hypothetical protein
VFFTSFYDFLLSSRFTLSTNYNLTNDTYVSNYFNNTDLTFINKYTNEENSDAARYLRFYNPVFKYDYKSGDYFPKLYKEVYTHLFTTANDLTNSVRTSP